MANVIRAHDGFILRILWISKNDLAEVRMSSIKFSVYISVFCLGTWGLIAGGIEQYFKEIFIGMIAPLIIGVVSVLYISYIQKKSQEKLTNILLKAFMGKMIFYGAYFIYIFTFYTFTPIPFILSFVGYFITLHVCEALFLKSIFLSTGNNEL